MVTLHVPKIGAINFLTSLSIIHKQLKDTVKTDRVSSVKLIMWYVCLNMSAHHGVFLNMFSNKNSVIPRCNRQSGEGRNINHPGSAFPSLVRYDLTGCQLQNSESLNSAPRSFHLRYTKQSLSPPSLFSSTWAPHWTSSHKSEPNSQLREKKTQSSPLSLEHQASFRLLALRNRREILTGDADVRPKLRHTECSWQRKSSRRWQWPTYACRQGVS